MTNTTDGRGHPAAKRPLASTRTVLLFSPHSSGGGGVVNFADTLEQHLGSEFRVDRFRVGQRSGRIGLMLRLLFPVYDALRLLTLAVFERHDIYHLNPSLDIRSVLRDGCFLLVLRLLRRRNILVFFHGWDPSTFDRIRAKGLFRALFRWTYGYAASIIVLAASFRQDLISLGLTASNIDVSTTMFNANEISTTPPERRDNEFRLLFLARFVPLKGIFPLLTAFSNLASRHPNMVLIMAGNGPEMPQVLAWCREHNLAERVRFPGYVEGRAKGELLASADVFVLPSFREGCPVSLLEAMASSLPVIVTPVGGVPNIVQEGENGLLIAINDSTAIEDAVEALVHDSALRANMAMRNRDKSWQHYEAKRFTCGLEHRYRAILERR